MHVTPNKNAANDAPSVQPGILLHIEMLRLPKHVASASWVAFPSQRACGQTIAPTQAMSKGRNKHRPGLREHSSSKHPFHSASVPPWNHTPMRWAKNCTLGKTPIHVNVSRDAPSVHPSFYRDISIPNQIPPKANPDPLHLDQSAGIGLIGFLSARVPAPSPEARRPNKSYSAAQGEKRASGSGAV